MKRIILLVSCLLLLWLTLWMASITVWPSSDHHHATHLTTDALVEPPAQSSTTSDARNLLENHQPIIIRTTAIESAADALLARDLTPRRRLPKEPLHIPPGNALRLIVKLADHFAARATSDHQLEVTAHNLSECAGLNQLISNENLSFTRLHAVNEAELAALRRRARINSGCDQPDLASQLLVATPNADRSHLIALAQKLHALDEVEYAELASLDCPPPPPAADIAPVTPSLVALQTYRQAANGIDLDYLWNTYGITGDPSLNIRDCEYDFNASHEDLSGLVHWQPNVVSRFTGYGNDHGTAVMGILASGRNNYGTTGSVPDCTTWFYPEFSTLTTGTQDRTACVTAAIAHSSPGDIVMLEMQIDGPAAGSSDYVPAEYTMSVWQAVKTGSDAGVITIAAAGNGNQNLDLASLFSDYHARGDSGAILVGAGDAARVKSSFSTYGSRINLQGWGSAVFSTGYGTYATYGKDSNQKYTATFDGTSSATPIVTSAAALIQSVAIRMLGTRLTPARMRTLLTTTGRPQTGTTATSQPIGPRPDLRAATISLLASDPPTFATLESWGIYHFATPTPDLSADPDHDQLSNLIEYMLGTQPNASPASDANYLPHLTIDSQQAGTRFIYQFHQPATRTGARWQVQSSSTLTPNSWHSLTNGIDGITITRNGDFILVSGPTDSHRFLRLQCQSP